MSNTINQARKILEKEKPSEIAARLGVKSQSNIGQLRDGKRPLTEKMAARIVEAYGGKAQEKKPAKKPPTEKKPETVTVTSKGKKLDLSNRRTADAFLEEIEKQAQLDQFESMARSVVSKVVREEVVPALNEKIGRCIEGAVIDPGVKVKIAELEGKIKLLEGELAELKEAKPIPLTPHIGIHGGGLVAMSGKAGEPLEVKVDGHEVELITEEEYQALDAGILTRNDIRERRGLEPIEGGGVIEPDQPSGYCPSDLPGRGMNAPKETKSWWRRSKK